jgi:hypothetical protein
MQTGDTRQMATAFTERVVGERRDRNLPIH